MGLIWWADVMNDKGEMESIRDMEARTQRKWTVAEKQEYGKIKGQLESPTIRDSKEGKMWREICERWSKRGRRPVSEVRQDDPMQRLRQQGRAWDMEGIEEARVAPKTRTLFAGPRCTSILKASHPRDYTKSITCT